MNDATRSRVYIDPELQFPIVLAFILLATIEGLFVGAGFYKLIALAKEWDRPNQAFEFFVVLGLTIVPVVAFNFALGIWISHKIAGPLVQIRRALNEAARGNLEVEVSVRDGDLLRAPVQDVNRLVQTLRRLVYRDYGYVSEADAMLTSCKERLTRGKKLEAGDFEDLQQLLNHAKAKLSIVNAHFMKGRKEDQ